MSSKAGQLIGEASIHESGVIELLNGNRFGEPILILLFLCYVVFHSRLLYVGCELEGTVGLR
jgi:hypothetical protein